MRMNWDRPISSPRASSPLAKAADFPQVLLEHVYTADTKDVPALKSMLKTGLDVKLARTLDLAAVIHVQRLANGSLEFTAVPLLYGSYALKQGAGTFSLEPPPGINLIAGLPIIRAPAVDQDLQTFAQYQQQNTPHLDGPRPTDVHPGGGLGDPFLGVGASECQSRPGNLTSDARPARQEPRISNAGCRHCSRLRGPGPVVADGAAIQNGTPAGGGDGG